MYAQLILQLAIVFPTYSLCKKFHIDSIFFIENYYMMKLAKKHSKMKEFSLFPNFVVKRKAFELTYFPVVFPV